MREHASHDNEALWWLRCNARPMEARCACLQEVGFVGAEGDVGVGGVAAGGEGLQGRQVHCTHVSDVYEGTTRYKRIELHIKKKS